MDKILKKELGHQQQIGIRSQNELLAFLKPQQQQYIETLNQSQSELSNKKTLSDLLSKEVEVNPHKKYQSLLDSISLLHNEVR
jgi:hypothetical protein